LTNDNADEELLSFINKTSSQSRTRQNDAKNDEEDLFALIDIKPKSTQQTKEKEDVSELLNIEQYIAQQEAKDNEAL
jgi:hypothetical protein